MQISVREPNGNYLTLQDYTTIGGWIFGQLGRLPKVGDRLTAGSHELEVCEMEGRRVKAIKVVGREQPVGGSSEESR